MADEKNEKDPDETEIAMDGDTPKTNDVNPKTAKENETNVKSNQENVTDAVDDNSTNAITDVNDSKIFDTEVHALLGVDVEITAVLGTASMQISQILKLGRGAVVELDRLVGEDIEINANNRLVAKGEVIVIEDKLGVTITNTIKMTE